MVKLQVKLISVTAIGGTFSSSHNNYQGQALYHPLYYDNTVNIIYGKSETSTTSFDTSGATSEKSTLDLLNQTYIKITPAAAP